MNATVLKRAPGKATTVPIRMAELFEMPKHRTIGIRLQFWKKNK